MGNEYTASIKQLIELREKESTLQVMSEQTLNLEERVLALGFLLDAVIWGGYLDDKEHRKKLATHLYSCVDGSQRHQEHPPAVQQALIDYADGLAEIDNSPDTIKSILRPFV